MEGGTVTMLLSDLHKIGPSDTPILLLLHQLQLLLPLGWTAPAGYCMQSTQTLTQALRVLGHLGTWRPGYLPYPNQQCALARAGPSLDRI